MAHNFTTIVYDFNSLLDNIKVHRYISSNEFILICFMSILISFYILSNHSEKIEKFFNNVVVRKSIFFIFCMILFFISGYTFILSLTILLFILYLIFTDTRFVQQKEFLARLLDRIF